MTPMVVYRSHCTNCNHHVSACTIGALIDAQREHERYARDSEAECQIPPQNDPELVNPFAWMM